MINPTRQSNRNFAFMWVIVLGIIAIIGWIFFDRLYVWIIVTAGIFLIMGMTVPGLLFPLNRLWSLLAAGLGVLSNYLILGLLLYLVFAPVGFIFRVLGRDPMCRKFEPDAASYLSPVNRQMDTKNMQDIF